MNKRFVLKKYMEFDQMKELEKIKLDTKIISLEDRQKGFSILIEVGENAKHKKDYLLYYMVHDKENFDELYRDVGCFPFGLKRYKKFDNLVKRLEQNLLELETYLTEEFEGFEGY